MNPIAAVPVLINLAADEWTVHDVENRGFITGVLTEAEAKTYFEAHAPHWLTEGRDWAHEVFDLRDFRENREAPLDEPERKKLEDEIRTVA